MFDISAKRLAWIGVEFAGFASEGDDLGKPVAHKVELHVDLVDRDEFLRLFVEPDPEADPEKHAEFAKLTEMDRFKGVVSGWRKVVSAGSPVPFEDPYIAAMLRVPNFGDGFNMSYLLAWKGRDKARTGNSESSAANGQANAAEL